MIGAGARRTALSFDFKRISVIGSGVRDSQKSACTSVSIPCNINTLQH
jgi:hypothetical protein